MSSDAKISANRENSSFSTGPSSPDGKAASAQNARRHGFSAQHVVIPPSQQPDFAIFEEALRAQLQPAGPVEEFLYRRILHAAWTVDQIDQTEAGLFTSSQSNAADMYLNDDNEKHVARFARYRTMHMRLYNQAMRSLQYEQTQRGLRQLAPATAQALASQAPPQANLHQISEFAKRSQSHTPFSTFPPEHQDQLHSMDLETQNINAHLRRASQLRREQAA